MIIPQAIRENFDIQKLIDGGSKSLCPAAIADTLISNLSKRESFTDETKSKWDKCMDKEWCKIVAIVCIVIGSLLVIWLISIIVNVIFCGAKCMKSLCWCCSCCRSNRSPPPPPPPAKPPYDSRGQAYNNPNMYYHPQNRPNTQQYYYAWYKWQKALYLLSFIEFHCAYNMHLSGKYWCSILLLRALVLGYSILYAFFLLIRALYFYSDSSWIFRIGFHDFNI